MSDRDDFGTDDCELLINDVKIYDKNKYDIYENCLKHYNKVIDDRDLNMNEKYNDQTSLNTKYGFLKDKVSALKKKDLTYNEEFKNNKRLIKFYVLENRIIFIVILLLIFLIYKYILK